jgi:hypothetical protein
LPKKIAADDVVGKGQRPEIQKMISKMESDEVAVPPPSKAAAAGTARHRMGAAAGEQEQCRRDAAGGEREGDAKPSGNALQHVLVPVERRRAIIASGDKGIRRGAGADFCFSTFLRDVPCPATYFLFAQESTKKYLASSALHPSLRKVRRAGR